MKIKIYKTGMKLRVKGEDVDINVRINERQLKEIMEILNPKSSEALI